MGSVSSRRGADSQGNISSAEDRTRNARGANRTHRRCPGTRDRRRPRTRWDPRSPEGRPSPLLRRRTRARRAAPGSEPGWGAGSARRRRAPRRRPMMRSKGIRSRALALGARRCHAPEHPPRTPSRLALRMGSFFWGVAVSALACPFRLVPSSGGRVWVLGPPPARGGPLFRAGSWGHPKPGRAVVVNVSAIYTVWQLRRARA